MTITMSAYEIFCVIVSILCILAIPCVIGAVIVGVFSIFNGIFVLLTEYIPIFDSILIGIICGTTLHNSLNFHSALCIILGIIVAGILTWIHLTEIGFRICTALFSVGWGVYFGSYIYRLSSDWLWFALASGFVALVTWGLHIRAEDSLPVLF